MASRASALKKIERLYGLIETMHSVALEQAVGLVREAEAAIVVQTTLMREARVDAREALSEGDWESWAIAETQRELGGQAQQSLEVVRQQREAATVEVRRIYNASRIRRGQIKSVVDSAAAAERIIDDRRAQNAADDRFLSRMRWSELREQAEGRGRT